MSNSPIIQLGDVRFQRNTDPDTVDARGFFWMWEPPKISESYVVSCDPTYGIDGWRRELRTVDDAKKDNAAIEVLRRGKLGKPDVQVAEYAAPIAPLELARVLNAIGRLYCGNADDGQAKMIVEVYPGPGLAVMQELVHRYGYTNFWMWQHIDKFTPTPTAYPGWYASNKQAQRVLWIKGHHYITSGGVIINSPWLVKEMRSCEMDITVMRGKAMYGFHDDRVYSFLMGLYALHDWALMEIPEKPRAPSDTKQPDYQACDISSEAMWEKAEEEFDRLLSETP